MPFPKRRKAADPERAADPQAVREAAIGLLAGRDFASAELRTKLEAQGYEAEAVATAVSELVAARLLNDQRYAENYVHHHAERGQGPLRIAQQLKGLGLPQALIDSALAAGPDWRARAREARIRRFGLEEPGPWPEKARQGRFLQYRGFSSDHIRAALGPDFDSNE
jgi:regulatory protein